MSLTAVSVLDTNFFPFVSLFTTGGRTFDLSYCILFCRVWLLSLPGLLFSEEKMKMDWILGR